MTTQTKVIEIKNYKNIAKKQSCKKKVKNSIDYLTIGVDSHFEAQKIESKIAMLENELYTVKCNLENNKRRLAEYRFRAIENLLISAKSQNKSAIELLKEHYKGAFEQMQFDFKDGDNNE
ncbi:MAG: hypothetical protein HRT87_06645 [Legionellales bacterium]|nr:hypothetical protein [Legionellales bacterium]